MFNDCSFDSNRQLTPNQEELKTIFMFVDQKITRWEKFKETMLNPVEEHLNNIPDPSVELVTDIIHPMIKLEIIENQFIGKISEFLDQIIKCNSLDKNMSIVSLMKQYVLEESIKIDQHITDTLKEFINITENV